MISIGCVSECGLEFYRETKGEYELRDCGHFTIEAVLPHLQIAQKDRLLMHELSLQLGNWIEGFEEPVQLVTDSLSWDWPWIQELFSDPGTWPANLDDKCIGLHEIVDSPFLEQMKNAIWRDPNCAHLRPKAPSHHALADAIVNKNVWQVSVMNRAESE